MTPPRTQSTTTDVAIVGAGLVGCLLACFLSRRGLSVTLYERRSDPRAADAERGRSINLAISARGIDALDRIGLRDQVMAEALPMRGRRIHDIAGQTVFTPYSHDGTRAIESISRSALNETLLSAALESPLVTAVFEHRLLRVGLEDGTLEFETPDGISTINAGVVIGADGAYSAVRARLLATPGFDYRQDYLGAQYKELTIPARDDDFAIDPEALHIWPRGGSMMIALPNPDHSFTCTLFWPHTGPGSFDEIDSGEKALAYFTANYPDAVPLIPHLIDEFDENPVGNLVTVRCARWSVNGVVGLIGDAAHAITPFFGQGANCGFEDVVELDRCLDETDGDWARAFPLYEQRRVANANAIADMALENFVEMSTRSASKVFQAQKDVEHTLERMLPEHYVSRYELVSFSTVPYAEVVRRTSVPSQARSVATGVASRVSDSLTSLTSLIGRKGDSA